jgi:adenosylmethionine-8-amino-7-oxononanoate aminotransferase
MTPPDPPADTYVFQRQINVVMPRAVKGDGVYIIDSDGKRYLDGSGGAAVSCLGHSDADVIKAIREQAETLAFAHTGFFTSTTAEELADTLIAQAPGGDFIIKHKAEHRIRRKGEWPKNIPDQFKNSAYAWDRHS